MLMQKLATMLEEGIVVLVIGMGTVFFFLVIMVFAMGIMSKIVCWLNKIFPPKAVDVQAAKKKPAIGIEEEIAVAIAAVMAK